MPTPQTATFHSIVATRTPASAPGPLAGLHGVLDAPPPSAQIDALLSPDDNGLASPGPKRKASDDDSAVKQQRSKRNRVGL